jgi:dsDNA-specific endonuclease/ATPase MutS2
MGSFALLENKEGKIISEGEVEAVLEEINEEVGEKMKMKTISGEVLMKMLSEGKMSDEVLGIVRDAIEASGFSEHIFNLGIPVSIDYKELEAQIKLQSATEFTDVAERIKRSASELKGIPEILKRLEAEILVEDFCCGICGYMGDSMKIPKVGDDLLLEDGSNMFLSDAQPVSFVLGGENKCSILTGANSGGKTTLLEHVLQNVSLFRMGLGVAGSSFECPMFDEVYYFAKTKGSTSKGAFETLLTQMAGIKSGGNTLILADEIEAVTEPGVAGRIIGATAEYFVQKGCFVVLATHLGAEIAKSLPEGARVDGIEASGLDENFNLIVNHNPVLGRLASSTPELIVERMARAHKGDYFEFLFSKMK